MKHLFNSGDRNFRLFLLANVFMGMGVAIDSSTFNNYLKEVFALGVDARTFLEFPREVPGFLATVFVGLLYSLGDIRMAAVANILAALGMFVLGVIPPVYGFMLITIFVYSTGQHLYMPLANTIGMHFAKEGALGHTLGKISSASTAALVTSAGLLLIIQFFVKPPYWLLFGIGAGGFLMAAVCLFSMDHGKTPPLTQRWVFRREYGLFYWLSVLWGARKQLIITFGPWVLVDVFKQPLSTMTLLFFIISVLGIFLKPWIGKMVDRLGERTVLGAEAFILAGVCVVYAFAAELLPPGIALVVISACYVLDQSSSWVGMARATWLKKIAVKPSDVSPTLSLGVSIDHIASMFIPMLGGFVWHFGGNTGYRWVFLGGAFIAALNYLSTRAMKVPARA